MQSYFMKFLLKINSSSHQIQADTTRKDQYLSATRCKKWNKLPQRKRCSFAEISITDDHWQPRQRRCAPRKSDSEVLAGWQGRPGHSEANLPQDRRRSRFPMAAGGDCTSNKIRWRKIGSNRRGEKVVPRWQPLKVRWDCRLPIHYNVITTYYRVVRDSKCRSLRRNKNHEIDLSNKWWNSF